MKTDLEPLLKVIEQKLNWGIASNWQGDDFENLHLRILEETGVSLSSSTLRRIWGRVDYQHAPSATTLNTLAKFAGYENWREFLKKQKEANTVVSDLPGPVWIGAPKRSLPWKKILATAGSLVVIVLVFLVAFKKAPRITKTEQYSFSSKPVTRGIPNSVIFTYDASASSADSIFIQQSWDTRTLIQVAKDQHQHTSIYYEPGFYQAKLMAGKETVKQHPLLIPTNGWLGTIDHKPVPVYLDSAAFIYKDSLSLDIAEIKRNNIQLEPQAPVTKYFNVGNFDPVPVTDFSFSAEIINKYREGSAVCQYITIILITDDGPVFIPLGATGCVSELYLYCIDHAVSGKKADLSAFGVDFSNWARVSCKSAGKKIQFYVNEKMAYECELPEKMVHIVGMSYSFQGAGAVKNITLKNKTGLVFHAF